MAKKMSRIFLESFIKNSLTNMKKDPERGIRNLVDMALTCSNGRFQKDFFTVAQTMLQKESSAYYDLIRNTVSHIDADRLCTLSMNLGYNACTEGAQCIRKKERELNCNIPWTILFQADHHILAQNMMQYNTAITEGEELGIHSWMFFISENLHLIYTLATNHPESLFFIFCKSSSFSPDFLKELTKAYNIMPVIYYDENTSCLCSKLQKTGLPYSVWFSYETADAKLPLNKSLFHKTQNIFPIFTVLVPERSCSKETLDSTYQTVKRIRNEQIYPTVVWDLSGDNRMIDSIVSGDACFVCFDRNGNLYNRNRIASPDNGNLFQCSLQDILISSFSKFKTK